VKQLLKIGLNTLIVTSLYLLFYSGYPVKALAENQSKTIKIREKRKEFGFMLQG